MQEGIVRRIVFGIPLISFTSTEIMPYILILLNKHLSRTIVIMNCRKNLLAPLRGRTRHAGNHNLKLFWMVKTLILIKKKILNEFSGTYISMEFDYWILLIVY